VATIEVTISLSLALSVTIDIPEPASNVNVSAGPSATIEDSPDTLKVLKACVTTPPPAATFSALKVIVLPDTSMFIEEPLTKLRVSAFAEAIAWSVPSTSTILKYLRFPSPTVKLDWTALRLVSVANVALAYRPNESKWLAVLEILKALSSIVVALVATLSCTVLMLVSRVEIDDALVATLSWTVLMLVELVAALAETVPIAFVRVTERLASLPRAAANSLRVSRVAGALSTRPAISEST